VFAKEGFVLTTMDAIALEAGVSKGGLYRHFPSKDELFLTLALSMLREIRGLLSATETSEPETGFAAFVAFIREAIGYAGEHAGTVKLALDCCSVREHVDSECPLLAEYDAELGGLVDLVVTILIRGQEDGSVRSDVEPACLAASVWGSLLGVLQFGQLGAQLNRRVALSSGIFATNVVDLIASSAKAKTLA
jgi:AcrR family transcriptional regulator